jgi:hypothetical protein
MTSPMSMLRVTPFPLSSFLLNGANPNAAPGRHAPT